MLLLHVLCNYNLLQWVFFYSFQHSTIGLLSYKGSTWFFKSTFNLFSPSRKNAIFFSPLYIMYMHGYWKITYLLKGVGNIGTVFDSQSLILVL